MKPRSTSSARRALLAAWLAVLPAASRAADSPAPAQSLPSGPAVPGTKTDGGGGSAPGKVKHLTPEEAAGVLGRPVVGPKGEDIGQVVNVLVDQAGHPRAAVINFGGFMGVGSRKIAVDWKDLHFAPDSKDGAILVDLTPDQIKAAPEYKENASKPTAVVAGPAKPQPGPSGGARGPGAETGPGPEGTKPSTAPAQAVGAEPGSEGTSGAGAAQSKGPSGVPPHPGGAAVPAQPGGASP